MLWIPHVLALALMIALARHSYVDFTEDINSRKLKNKVMLLHLLILLVYSGIHLLWIWHHVL